MKRVLEIWKRSPLLRIMVPMMIGVLAAEVPFWGESLVGLIFLFGAWFLARSGINRHWSRSHYLFLEGIFYAVVSAAAGWLLIEVRRPEYDDAHIMHERGKLHVIALQLEDEPKRTTSGWRVTTHAIALQEDADLRSVRGKVLLFLMDSAHQRKVHADDVIWVKAVVEPLAPPLNPGEFDFALYSARQYIGASIWAQQHQWVLDSNAQLLTWRGHLVRWRERLIAALDATPMEERERQVLAALVFGKTTELDAELIQAYASAGAVHVLAVSGLHVALIYILLKPLFAAVFGKRRAKWLRWSIPVALLWLYAALTGFSPSVLRAALMFSCFIVGETYGRTGNIFNTMSASIIILLLVDPMVIYSMGFLLSYLAVLGIVVIQGPLRRLWSPELVIMKKAWELVTISVAAQLATMPVTLYMFHQFPTWFIVTNLVVVPLSTIVLYTALSFFALLWWTTAADFVGGLLGLLTRLMNDMMTWSAAWPYALIDGIYWMPREVAWCSAIIISLGTAILFGSRRSWLWALALTIIWVGDAAYQQHRRFDEEELCFFSIKGMDAFTVVHGGVAMTYIARTDALSDEKLRRTVEPYVFAKHAAHVVYSSTDYWCESEWCYAQGQWELPLGQLVLMDSAGQRLQQLPHEAIVWFTDEANRLYLSEEQMQLLQGHTIILGNTYSRRKREWLKQHLSDSSRVIDLREGAWQW
jgi:competence protein ComEC